MAHERDQPTDPCEQWRHPRPRGDIDESKDGRGYEAQRRADDYKRPLLCVGAHRPPQSPTRDSAIDLWMRVRDIQQGADS